MNQDRDPYPYEKWSAYMEDLNEESEYNGGPRWITKRTKNTKDLSRIFLAMSPDNDPFWSGRPAEVPLGEWFGEIHKRRVGNSRRHIRALFYIASGEDPDPEGNQEPERWPDDPDAFAPKYQELLGVLIDKTKAKHWEMFQLASKYARNMGLVDPLLIIDTRTPVNEYFRQAESLEPYVSYEQPELYLPDVVSSSSPRLQRAQASVEGYSSYSYGMVPSLVEVWIEKELDSEDQPIVRSVCRSLGVNVVTGSGNMKISQAYGALRRQQDAGIPLRILFLSDFDDAGDHMPVSPARHIQFALESYPEDKRPDVRLFHLALTEGQVREQNIPSAPPTSEKEEQAARQRYFYERTGSLGTVQLNALTDTGPRAWWFRRLLTDAIKALRDPNLRQKRQQAEEEAEELLHEEFERLMRWPHRGLELVADRFREVQTEGFEEERRAIAEKNEEISRLIRERMALEDDLREKLAEQTDPLWEHATYLLGKSEERLEELDDLELPVFEAEEPEGSAEAWLFDSRRDYVKQQRHYNARKFGIPIPVDDDEVDEVDEDPDEWEW